MICLSSAGSLRWPQVGCFWWTAPSLERERDDESYRRGARDDACRHSMSREREALEKTSGGKEREARMPQTACSLHTQSDTPPPSLPAPPCSPSALLCTPPTCRHASPLYVPFFSLRSWKVQPFLNQHRTHSNAVCASSAVHLRPKTLPGENLGGPGPPAPPETTDGAGEPRTRHGQRTFSFDCLHFPTLSQRCPGPEQRRQDRGLPPSPPSATPGPGRQTFEDSMVHEVLCVT